MTCFFYLQVLATNQSVLGLKYIQGPNWATGEGYENTVTDVSRYGQSQSRVSGPIMKEACRVFNYGVKNNINGIRIRYDRKFI